MSAMDSGVGVFLITLTGLCDITPLEHHFYMSRDLRKPVFGVSDQVPHKPDCTTTEDGESLEISDLESRGIVLSV